MTELATDPAWRAQARAEGVVLYAGADQAYLLPDLTRAEVDAVTELFEHGRVTDPVRPLLPQLRGLGVLKPVIVRSGRPMSVTTQVVGHAPDGLLDLLPGGARSGDLRLLVRTTATLCELTAVAAELTGPHLLLDLAYHHTAVLGPLVVPGARACIGCMATRTARRWGDPDPARVPRAVELAEVAAALTEHALRQIATGSLVLLDRVIAYDLDELTTTAEDVLPSADCPICPAAAVGRVTLPWEDKP
jgi:bacteriocin biosynthesis cyclodehydratase domain-containing protein